jgi:hypothetical protein
MAPISAAGVKMVADSATPRNPPRVCTASAPRRDDGTRDRRPGGDRRGAGCHHGREQPGAGRGLGSGPRRARSLDRGVVRPASLGGQPDQGGRLPGHARTHQHPPPPVPEFDPQLPPRRQRHPVHLAQHPLPAVGRSGRGGGLPVGVGWPGRARFGRVHHLDRPPVRPSEIRRRPRHRRDLSGSRARDAVSIRPAGP